MNERILCPVCPRKCRLAPGERGVCGARINLNGKIVQESYGAVTAIALDPIEKKPLRMYKPGSTILSVGSYGCNLRCSFCQNYHISMIRENPVHNKMSPEMLVKEAEKYKMLGNIGLAYTYNEPLIGYEFVRDCANLIKLAGMDNVVVTNGYINEEPFLKLLSLIDAFNIDLKAYNQIFYRKIGGDLETVKNTIALATEKAHVEVTCLIIEGENDDEEEIRQMAHWISSINPAIPLHLSRFFPAYKMMDKNATRAGTIKRLAAIAGEYLPNVFLGNI